MFNKFLTLKLYILLSLILVPSFVFANIYEWRDSQGTMHYSSTPHAGATPIQLPASSHVTAPKKLAKPSWLVEKKDGANEGAPQTTYTQCSFITPKNGQTFQNQRQVPFSIQLEPILQADNHIQVFVDGKAFSYAHNKTRFVISNLERGEHQIQANVLDKSGAVLASTNAITIFIHYPTPLIRPNGSRGAPITPLLIKPPLNK